MAIYKMKFMFDWGSGICLWSANKAAETKFQNYPIFTSQMPVSDELKAELDHLIAWHDEALDWAEPNSDLLWCDAQIDAFLEAAKNAHHRLCIELGSDYEVVLKEGM